jgi:deoxyribodipyrimidine photo-lyase
VIDELFWRDFWRFWSMKYGNKIFSSYGIYNREYYKWKNKIEIINKWKEG